MQISQHSCWEAGVRTFRIFAVFGPAAFDQESLTDTKKAVPDDARTAFLQNDGLMLAAELLKAAESFIEDVERGAVADADALIISEGNAWDGGHLVA